MKIQTPSSLSWQRSLHFKGWESGNCTGGGCSWKTHMGNPWSALPEDELQRVTLWKDPQRHIQKYSNPQCGMIY